MRNRRSENARIMMEAALAVRGYTGSEINALLETQMKYSFLPQSVPAYSANQYFKQLRTKFPDYSYREATLNPPTLSTALRIGNQTSFNIFGRTRSKPSGSVSAILRAEERSILRAP